MASEALCLLEPWHQLDNKIVMVTGASSGLGREMCLDLAEGGCKIIAAARRVDRLTILCNQINQPDVESNNPIRVVIKAVAVELDVSGPSGMIEAAVLEAWNAFGRIDALINNAGVRGSVKSSLDLPEEEWNDVTNTNYRGQWLVAKYIGQRMRDSCQGGSIINISSAGGINRPIMPGAVAYSSSKAALDAVTRMMALELGKFNIRVNSIALGFFRSEITKSLFDMKGFDNVIARTAPLQDLGSSNPALTSLVRYLLHDSSGYISANIFIVDSGYSLAGFPIFSSL